MFALIGGNVPLQTRSSRRSQFHYKAKSRLWVNCSRSCWCSMSYWIALGLSPTQAEAEKRSERGTDQTL